MSLDAELEDFEAWLLGSRGVRPSSAKVYLSKSKNLTRFLQARGIDTFSPAHLTPELLREFRSESMAAESSGKKDVKEVLQACRMLVKWSDNPVEAEERGFRTDRTKALKYPSNGSTRDRRFARLERLPMLTPEHVVKLMAIAKKVVPYKMHSKRNSALIACLYSSGGRLSEVLSMRVRDFSFNEEKKAWECFFPRSKHRARERVGWLSGFAGDNEVIEWWRARKKACRSEDEPLFVTARNKRLYAANFYHLYSQIKTQAAEEDGELRDTFSKVDRERIAAHLFRHSRAKFLGRMKGWTFAPLQQWLGDKDKDMVLWYCQPGGIEAQLAKDRGEKASTYAEPEIACPSCGAYWSPGSNYCQNCGEPMSPTAAKIESAKRDVEAVLAKLLRGKTLDEIINEAVEKRLAQEPGTP